jgi:hypothetical protein
MSVTEHSAGMNSLRVVTATLRGLQIHFRRRSIKVDRIKWVSMR